MNKALFLSIFLVASLTGLSQKADKLKSTPDEKISVKKEYDKDGNLIRFDSLRVFTWSGDSLFRFSPDGGWADFFGQDFPFDRFGKKFPADSLNSFRFPGSFPSFRFFGEDDFFKDFGMEPDSSFLRNFMFMDDTSFFMGPHSSMMLPPGFFAPGPGSFPDIRRFLGKDFKSMFPDEFFNLSPDPGPGEQFISPRQKEEWEKMMRRQQQEQEEFYKRWNQQKPNKKIEKM